VPLSKNSTTMSTEARISPLTATAIVVADMVGVGVFTSLGFQVKDISSGFVLMLLWTVGGIVALCGAICYAELASMFPRSSGEYNFLARTYHPALGFLAGWLSATVGFAAPVALAAMAFGEYLKAIVPGAPSPVLGLGIIWLIAIVQLLGIRHSSIFQTTSTVIKLFLIVAFIAAGFILGHGQPISFKPSLADTTQLFSAPFAIGLVFVMYSYAGWNAATYIIEEIRDPSRSLPRALFGGTLIVLLLYVALNAVFLYTTPVEKMSGQLDVAVIAGTYIFGDWGGRLVGALICIGLVSSISAMMWIGPRVTVAMGEDFTLLRIFSRKSNNNVPVVAILFQVAIASLLLGTQMFEAVLDFIQFSLIFCSFLAVMGVIKLRYTHPQLARPYRAWGYPVTPLIFMSVALFMMYYLITNRPMQSLAGFLMMLAGLVIYGIAQTRVSRVSVQPVIIPNSTTQPATYADNGPPVRRREPRLRSLGGDLGISP
jgi:APA family basic amino acid/polyamine antiporter